jgi:polyisoprenoid-binding protein YceI
MLFLNKVHRRQANSQLILFLNKKANKMAKWTIDTGHSEVQFKVKHLAISNIAGTFKMFSGNVKSGNEDFNNAEVECIIDADSLDTNNVQRDKDLKSDVFLDTQRFPTITFVGTLKKNAGDYVLTGDLTIRGIVKKVALPTEFTGIGIGRFNDERAGFEVDGKINRKDFGLTWNMLTETGGLIVGEDIKLHFDIELTKQAD